MKSNFKSKFDWRRNIYVFTNKVVKWLCLSLKKDGPSIPLSLLEELCNRLDRIAKGRGVKELILYVKSTRNNFYNYLSGNPLRDSKSPCYGNSRFPSILGPLKQYVDDDNKNVIRLILTILTATRALKLKGDVCTDSITQPLKGDVPNITKHMLSFWEDLGYKCKTKELPRKLSRVDWQMYRRSRGPNGQALLASHYEALILPDSLIKSLEVLARGITTMIKDVSIGKLMWFQEIFCKPTERPRGLIRRNVSFPDKEGKQRTIGILDYWSQMALKPIHQYIGRVLEKIPQDCTLDQSKFKDLILNKSEIYYSVDLSSATDRFPIMLIKELLSVRLPQHFVDAWASVLVDYPFDYQGNKLIYSVGTPMGSYTSFNSFALTHHYIVYYCCKELGVSWKKLPYALLGDDIVIGNKSVGEMYMKVIKSLHMDYSMAKTHRSENFFEFAKRVFYKNEEISPFPISALRASSKSSDTLVLVIKEAVERGYCFDEISSSVCLYFSLVKEFRSKLCKKIALNSFYFARVLDCTRGIVPAWEVFNDILRKNNLPSKFTEKMHLREILDLSYIKLLQNNIISAMLEIKNYRPTSVMKSNTILEDYYSFSDELKKCLSNDRSDYSCIVSSPLYGAIIALEKELKDEKQRVLQSIDNNTLSVDKKSSKSKYQKLEVKSLWTDEKDKKKIVNTTRELYILIEKEVLNYYWLIYDNPYYINSVESTAAKEYIRQTIRRAK